MALANDVAAQNSPFDLRQVLRAHAALAGGFQQTQQIAGLAGPVESSGKFVILSGQGLVWTTLIPDPQEYVMSIAAADKADGRIHRLVLELLDGDVLEDRRFVSELTGDVQEWQLSLQPVQRRMRRFVREITVHGDALVRGIVMRLQQDQVLTIAFTDVHPLQEVDPALCAKLSLSAACLQSESTPGP